jgi:carboxypeptidase family protein
MIMLTQRARSIMVAAAMLLSSTIVLAQTPAVRRAEVIRGRVTTDSGKPLANVAVIATMAPDRTFQQSLTDSSGAFEIRFAAGTGDYLVYAGPVGYRAFRRRVTIPPANNTLVVDIRLTSEPRC